MVPLSISKPRCCCFIYKYSQGCWPLFFQLLYSQPCISQHKTETKFQLPLWYNRIQQATVHTPSIYYRLLWKLTVCGYAFSRGQSYFKCHFVDKEIELVKQWFLGKLEMPRIQPVSLVLSFHVAFFKLVSTVFIKSYFQIFLSSKGHWHSHYRTRGITTQQLSNPGFSLEKRHCPTLAQPCALRAQDHTLVNLKAFLPMGPWLWSQVSWGLSSRQPGSADVHSHFRPIQQQARKRDVENPIKISSIMWHTLTKDRMRGFGSAGPHQVGLYGVSHFRFKSLLNPLLRLVVNNIFISVFRDDRQPSSPAGPEASAPLLGEAGSVDERQKSHCPSVSWLAGRKAEWQTSFQSAWPMQGNGAIWPERGFRLLLCEREGGWRENADLNPPTMHSHLAIS